MVSHLDVATEFVNREKEHRRGFAMFFEQNVIYSWGYHFPIACWVGKNVALFNVDGWKNSVSTKSHTRIVDGALRNTDALIIEVDVDTIKKYLSRLGRMTIEKEYTPRTIEQAVCELKRQMRMSASPYRVGWFIKKLKEQLKTFQFFEEL